MPTATACRNGPAIRAARYPQRHAGTTGLVQLTSRLVVPRGDGARSLLEEDPSAAIRCGRGVHRVVDMQDV